MERKLARIACFLSLGVVLVSANAHAFGKKSPGAEPITDDAGQVLSAFQSGCSSIGSWTASAQAQTQTFLALIDTIQYRDACKPYKQQLEQISSLSSQISAVTSNSDYVTYRQTQEQVQELTLALQGAKDPSTIAALTSALSAAQVNLATQRGTVEGDAQVSSKDRFWTQSGQIAGYMGSLMSAVDPNSSPTLYECLKESPSAAVGMATNLLAMGGSFISPVYGAAAAVVGQLVNMGTQIFEEIPYLNAKESLKSAELPISLSCGLESMSELYCDADDSFQLIQLAADSYDNSAHSSPVWRGLDLLGRRFPVLMNWLHEVKNGVPPSDPTQAQQQANALRNLSQVEIANLFAVGSINQAVQFYNASHGTNPSYIFNVIINTGEYFGQMDQQAPGIPQDSGGIFTNYEPNPLRWACWLALGQVPDSDCHFPPRPPAVVPSFVHDYVIGLLNNTVSDTLVNSLLTNWYAAYQNVYNYAMVQFSQTITTNADSLLAEAKQGNNNLSPYEVLSETNDFIDQMLQNQAAVNPRLVTTLQEKKLMIQKAQWYIDAADNDVKDWGDGAGPVKVCPELKSGVHGADSAPRAQNPGECQRWRLSRIFDLFDLKDGVQVFTTDVNKFVTWDLQRRLDQGQLPTDVSEILRTAGIDISLRMQSAGLSGLWQVQDDLNNSRKLSMGNLLTFRDFFAPAFTETVQGLANLAANEPDGPNRPNGELLGRLCALWLVTEQDGRDFPDDKTEKMCRDAKLYSIYAKRGADGHYIPSLEVSELQKKLQGRSFMDRVCEYHKYLRQERLAEIVKNGS